MGKLYNGVCFADAPTVKQHFAADFSKSWGSGPTLYTSEVTTSDFSGDGFTVCVRADGGACVTTAHTFPVFSECDYGAGSVLAMEYFPLILGFLVVVWVASHIKNLFWRPYDPV